MIGKGKVDFRDASYMHTHIHVCMCEYISVFPHIKYMYIPTYETNLPFMIMLIIIFHQVYA